MWILIILVYVGGMSDQEANALASVPGFKTHAACEAAAQQARSSFSPGKKSAVAICVADGSGAP